MSKPRPILHEYKNLKVHPYTIFMSLLLVSLGALFFGFTAAYMYARLIDGREVVPLPTVFVFNSLFLIGSSVSLMWALKSYKQDDTLSYQYALLATLVLTLVFMVAQYYGWTKLGEVRGMVGGQYIKVLSIMHFVHVLGGLPFLGMFLWTAYRRMQEPVSVLVYFSDPEKRLKLKLLNMYWHFLDGLWLFLVVLFLLSGYFR